MQCPKCNHIQAESAECRKCGVIFARYEAYEQRKKDLAEQKSQTTQARTSGILKFSQVIVLVLVVAATTYYFTRPKGTEPQPASMTEQVSEAVVEVTAVEKEPKSNTTPANFETQKSGVIRSLVGSPVERAREATVSIETPWGTGSGFFIEKNHIVTNRHVVEFNSSDLKEMRDKIRTNRKLIDLEEQKIDELRQQMEEMPDGPTKSQLEIIIKERKKYMAKVMKQQRESEKKLAKLEREAANPEIKIILSDGSSHTIGYMLTSQNYDLALLSLYSHEGRFLRRPPEGKVIRQGDKVFTIGSPVGLRHTVTSGVFSGFRERETDDQVFLQTDAAINPGNSGGPLIDENGFVHGVNTMIVRDTEGIGFAIPIEKVFEEFSSTLE